MTVTTYTTIPFPIGDHAIDPCDAYRVEVDINGLANTVLTFVGQVPQSCSFDLTTTTGTVYNWIILPFGNQGVTMASELKQAIEDDTGTTVISVIEWNAPAQSYTTIQIEFVGISTEAGKFGSNQFIFSNPNKKACEHRLRLFHHMVVQVDMVGVIRSVRLPYRPNTESDIFQFLSCMLKPSSWLHHVVVTTHRYTAVRAFLNFPFCF